MSDILHIREKSGSENKDFNDMTIEELKVLPPEEVKKIPTEQLLIFSERCFPEYWREWRTSGAINQNDIFLGEWLRRGGDEAEDNEQSGNQEESAYDKMIREDTIRATENQQEIAEILKKDLFEMTRSELERLSLLDQVNLATYEGELERRKKEMGIKTEKHGGKKPSSIDVIDREMALAKLPDEIFQKMSEKELDEFEKENYPEATGPDAVISPRNRVYKERMRRIKEKEEREKKDTMWRNIKRIFGGK